MNIDPAEEAKPARVYDLEDRLLGFASEVIDIAERLPATKAAAHVGGQFLRSGTSVYGHHGEAQDAESPDDFIHKMKVCLKELRETRRWARLIALKKWLKDGNLCAHFLDESDQLIRIFKSSIQTAERNRVVAKRPVRPAVQPAPAAS